MASASNRGVVKTKVVIASTVMLSFITYWGAAAIVLGDLAGSAYYACGITETFIGKSAPWFILAIMLFSYAVRALYIESCSMFVRGGVYRVVNEALGSTLAKFSVSALLFDYMLVGPVSGVSAGLYLAGLINETAERSGHAGFHVNPQYFAAGFGVLATLYFWRQNTIGIHESSKKALRIVQLTTIMGVLLIGWCLLTMVVRGFQPVPLPTPGNIHFSDTAVGWLKGSWITTLTSVMILIGLGHSVLAMSGEETLAQVNREIASPKLKNLERTGFVVFVYSLLLTSLVSFFAVMLIPDAERKNFLDNLIGGLAMNVIGPVPLKLAFHAFVVFVGVVLLAGGINTSIVGSNGVLNRVAEDGVLPDWFRHPHHKFGTTYRLINLMVGLQIATIVLSRGDLTILGEAFAFGVMWSFTMKALGVLVLRFKMPQARAWKVPLNLRWGDKEIPVGLVLITIALFAMALANLVTKKIATIAGIAFTAVFFLTFSLTERYYRRRRAGLSEELEKFRLEVAETIDPEVTSVRPGNILVAVRNPNQMEHLNRTLDDTDTEKIDIVVVTVSQTGQPEFGEHEPTADEIFSEDVAKLFSGVVMIAEAAGKHVELMVVPGRTHEDALAATAQRLGSNTIVMGTSGKVGAAVQAKAFGDAWERLPKPRPQLDLELVDPHAEEPYFYNLGPHPPRLWPEDLEFLHRLWLDITSRGIGPKLHHRDVVRVALRLLDRTLRSEESHRVLAELKAETGKPQRRVAGSDGRRT